MEQFEKEALFTANLKPTTWLRYVEDTFVVQSLGDRELDNFLAHLNNIHPSIQFTMENRRAFLDALVISRTDKELGNHVYRKQPIPIGISTSCRTTTKAGEGVLTRPQLNTPEELAFLSRRLRPRPQTHLCRYLPQQYAKRQVGDRRRRKYLPRPSSLEATLTSRTERRR